jgi:hypothetical protein
MSVRRMTKVWDHSVHSGPHLLMLLCVANFENDDGRPGFPSVETLAKMCRMKRRNAQAILSTLRESGELDVQPNQGPKGTNLYRTNMGKGVQESAGVQVSAPVQVSVVGGAVLGSKGVQVSAPKPEGTIKEPEDSSRKRSATPSAARGTRLADNWEPTADLIDYCRDKRPDLNPNEVAEAFRDYWQAKAGKDGRKADWAATWRTWVRNQRAVMARPNQRQQALDDGHVFGAAA